MKKSGRRDCPYTVAALKGRTNFLREKFAASRCKNACCDSKKQPFHRAPQRAYSHRIRCSTETAVSQSGGLQQRARSRPRIVAAGSGGSDLAAVSAKPLPFDRDLVMRSEDR